MAATAIDVRPGWWSTRVTASAALSFWRQDDAFIPVTTNSAITDPRIAQVPASLDGRVRTTNLSASITTRPMPALALSARYRSYEYRDEAGVSAILDREDVHCSRVADAPLGIDEVFGGPILIVHRLPQRIIVIQRDWILDAHVGDGAARAARRPCRRCAG